MDGYTLTQRLRARPAFAQTTFVIISARCGMLDRLKARLAGAQVYLSKPITTQAILSVVQEFLQDVQTLHAARFPEQSFDLIRMAFVAPAMLTLDFQALVRTLLPLCRPGGMVRWTEMVFPVSSSPALARLIELTCHALQAAGHSFVSPWMLELNDLLAQWRDEQGMPQHPIKRHHQKRERGDVSSTCRLLSENIRGKFGCII